VSVCFETAPNILKMGGNKKIVKNIKHVMNVTHGTSQIILFTMAE
jgi:hypothetical protein